ncbi:DUF551 domain-containing protein [Klebsiella pneumoniae]|uniref:DUF551 domain-containing protein n=2 Tax=Klebsiella TaxID=570 RepID=UPI003B3A3410
MTNNQLTREENVQAVFDLKAGYTLGLADVEILKRVARMALAAMASEPHTDGELSNLLWYSQEATCHSDPNYYCEFQRLATPGLIAGIIRELQERRKADSEPVAYMYDGEDGTEYNGHNEFSGGGKGIPLYRHAQQPVDSEPVGYLFHNEYGAVLYSISDDATEGFSLIGPIYSVPQPAQVVPEEATPDSIEILASARRRDHAVFQWDEDQRNAAADSWNAFRAAMLQELKKSAGTEAICRSDENVQVLHTKSPAQSDCCPAQNQGWIPVSERMPEKGQAVLVYRPKAHEGGDSDVRVAVYGRHNFEHGFGCYWEPSHWMPLPAAPQEVK